MPRAQTLELSNLSITYLLLELRPLLEGAFVEKVQDLENNWLKIKIRTKQGSRDLIFSPSAVFLADYRVNARQQSSGFGAFLRKRIQGKKIVSIKQHGFERIIALGFWEFTLIAELFGKGNLLLLDSNGLILRPYRKESWSSRTLASRQKYVMPPSRGINPERLTVKELANLFNESKLDVVRTLISGVNIPPIIAEEVCSRASIEKETIASTLSIGQTKSIHSEIKKLYSKPSLTKENPCLVVHSNKRVLLPFEPFDKKRLLQGFDSINSALNELILLPFLKPESREDQQRIELERTLAEQRKALEKSERSAAENRRKAELIYLHYSELMEAVNELRALAEQRRAKKDVMYKRLFGCVALKDVDFKKKRAVFEVLDE